jgi:hypothetical protein
MCSDRLVTYSLAVIIPTVIQSVYAQNCTLTHLPTNMDFLRNVSELYLLSENVLGVRCCSH